MRSTAWLLGMIALSGVLAVAWTLRVQSHQKHARVIKFAYLGSVADARHLSALRFKDIVESESQGGLRVELYGGGQLGGDRDAIEAVTLGVIEMSVAGAGVFATFEPGMGISALPYLFEDFEQAWVFVDSELHAQVERRLLPRGLRILAHWENGFRCVTTSARAVASLGDLRGLKIRTPENPMILATLKALGANPGPLPWTELYMALQQRAFDGQENPIPIIYANKLYEVQRYLSLTNHVYEPMPVVIGEFFWTSLTREHQQIIQQAMAECQRFNRALVVRQTEEMLEQLEKEGMIVSRPDLGPFRRATHGVARQFVDALGRDVVEAVHEGKRGHSTFLPERREK